MKHFLLSTLFLLAPTYELPLFGQALETEFKDTAADQWLELRKNAFDSSAIVVETCLKEFRRDVDSNQPITRTIETRQIQFTEGDFKYFESIPVSDNGSQADLIPFNRRHVYVHNSDQTFSVYKDPESEWFLMGVEDSPSDFAFSHDTEHRNLRPGRNRGPLSSLTESLKVDTRLMTDRTTSVDRLVTGYLELDETSFTDFTVDIDENFGRIVTTRLSGKIDLTEHPRKRPTPAVAMTIEGEFKFLADWKWLPLTITITHREFDKHATELRKTTKTMRAEYDANQVVDAQESGKDLIPKRVKITSTREPDQQGNEISHTIRPLTANEIQTIKAMPTLSAFGLKQ